METCNGQYESFTNCDLIKWIDKWAYKMGLNLHMPDICGGKFDDATDKMKYSEM